MISPELIRRYPFFSGLNFDQITTLAKVAEEVSVETGHYFFHEGDRLRKLFLVMEGKVDVTVSITDRNHVQDVAEQIVGNFITEHVAVSTIGPGQLFAWSALLPPYVSTAGARALAPSRVLAFDSEDLYKIFQEDCAFGYLMLQKVAGVIRQRLRDMRIQSLAFVPA
jgi:CRP-like cAMP-binding protein